MLTVKENQLFYAFSQLKSDPLPEPIQPYAARIGKLVHWVYNYLCKAHEELGRTGPICPFVPTSLEKKLLFVSVFPHVDEHTPMAERQSLVLAEQARFLAMEPQRGNNAQFKASLILFPNLPDSTANDVIDELQGSLQDAFVEKGLMIGEFHPGPPNKPGLWNDDFKPLHCPIALLAIRHMVPTDILFLKDRSLTMTEYLRHFSHMVPTRFQHLVEEAAEKFGFDLPDNHPVSSAPTVIYWLQKNKISYSVHRHAVYGRPIKRPQDFAELLGYEVARISKALFVRNPKKTTYAILVCGAARKVDMAAVAARLGVERLELAEKEELRSKVGHPPMAVTPIGVEGVSVFMDEDLFRHETILTGAGVTKMEIELSPQDLKRLSEAQVFSFAV